MFSATNVENGRLVEQGFRFISSADFAIEDARTSVSPNDVLLTIVGTIGRSLVVPENMKPFALQRSVAVLKPLAIEPRFLSYQLRSPAMLRFFEVNARGTAQKGVYLGTLSTTPCVLPPLPEQARIVARIEELLSQIDAGAEGLRDVQKKLKRYRASILKAACEGTLVPTEADLARLENRAYEPASDLIARILTERRARWEADQLEKMRAAGKEPKDDKWKARYQEPAAPDTSGLPNPPEGWKWVILDSITSHVADIDHNMPRAVEDGVLFLSAKDLLDDGTINFTKNVKRISEADFLKLSRKIVPQRNDIIYSRIGARLGKARLVETDERFLVSYSCCTIRPIITDPSFLCSYLGSDVVLQRATGKAKSIGVPDLGLDEIKRFAVPLPPLAEQERIVAEVELRLSVVDQMEAALAANLKRADRLRQAVLRDAFAGKLVPQDPNDEPASALLERIRAEREEAAAAQARPTRKKETANGRHNQNDPAGTGVPRRLHQGKRNAEKGTRIQSELLFENGV